ncbi:MAG: glycosyltransferase family 39 protein [Planctomycetes bacterium]|nr:glycosyltransferase family 39 protein [Planctomycetota bacterium]
MLLRALLLLLLTVTACVPQLVMRDLRGTEGRRIQIAAEMVRTDSWMVPVLGDEPTLAKPPLHYWILGGLIELFGPVPWILRLPAVVGLFLCALLAMVLLRQRFGEAAGWVGALGVICSPLAVFEWASAEIDPLFAVLTATSLWCLAAGIARDRAALAVLSGLLGGLAMLQKGPPYFVFAAGAYLVWWRRRGLRFALHHFVPLFAVPLCYYVPLWLWHVSPTEMWEVTQSETLGRIATFQWQHVAKTPLFWLRAAVIQLPFVLWCFWEWRGARDARMDAADLMLRMCSGAAVFAIVILTFFPGRPTRYLLPNVPLFIFAVAPAVAHFAGQRRELGSFSRRMLRGVGVFGAVGLVAMPFLLDWTGVAVAGAFLVAGLGHMLVRAPRQLVAFVLVVPVVAAWTAGFHRALHFDQTTQALGPVGQVLRAELERRGIVDEVHTYGHVDSKMLLGAGLMPPGDEFCRERPTAKWLLVTRDPTLGEVPPEYVDRLVLATPRLVFALLEKR